MIHPAMSVTPLICLDWPLLMYAVWEWHVIIVSGKCHMTGWVCAKAELIRFWERSGNDHYPVLAQ